MLHIYDISNLRVNDLSYLSWTLLRNADFSLRGNFALRQFSRWWNVALLLTYLLPPHWTKEGVTGLVGPRQNKSFKKKLGSLIKEVESGHNVFLYSFWDSLSLKINFNWTLYWRPVWGTWCQTSRSRPTSQEHLTSHFLYLKHPKRIISNDQEWRTERLLLWRKSLKMFKMVNLKAFWWSKRKEYPPISDNAVKFPFVFRNVYLSECGLPSVIYIKSKFKTILIAELDFSRKLTKVEPDMVSCVWLNKYNHLHTEDLTSS